MSVSCNGRAVDGGGGRSGKPGARLGASPGSADVSDGTAPRGPTHHRRQPIIILYSRTGTAWNKRRRQRGAGGKRSPQERRAAPSSEPRGRPLAPTPFGLQTIETRRKLCSTDPHWWWKHCHWTGYTERGRVGDENRFMFRTVVRAWLRVVVAVGWAMLSGGAREARAGHGGLLLDTAVRPVRASAARAARHWAAHRPRPRPPALRAHARTRRRDRTAPLAYCLRPAPRAPAPHRPHDTTLAIYRLSTLLVSALFEKSLICTRCVK